MPPPNKNVFIVSDKMEFNNPQVLRDIAKTFEDAADWLETNPMTNKKSTEPVQLCPFHGDEYFDELLTHYEEQFEAEDMRVAGTDKQPNYNEDIADLVYIARTLMIERDEARRLLNENSQDKFNVYNPKDIDDPDKQNSFHYF